LKSRISPVNRSPFFVIMTAVDPMIRGFAGFAGEVAPALRGLTAGFFFCFCASAAVPAQSKITMTVISDLILFEPQYTPRLPPKTPLACSNGRSQAPLQPRARLLQ